MMGLWGTGVLPPPIQKGQPWVGVGKQSNCPPFHVSTALVPDLALALIPTGKWHFSEFPPKHQHPAWMRPWLFYPWVLWFQNVP